MGDKTIIFNKSHSSGLRVWRIRPAGMVIPFCKEAHACVYGSGTENPPWLQLRGCPAKIRLLTHYVYQTNKGRQISSSPVAEARNSRTQPSFHPTQLEKIQGSQQPRTILSGIPRRYSTMYRDDIVDPNIEIRVDNDVVGTFGLRIRTRGDTMSGVKNGMIKVVEVIIGDRSGRKWAGIGRLEWAGIRRLEWLSKGKGRLE
ncbi:hypothetical protein Tco_1007024 [Tanacetum coccineum]|uniref:Ribosomal protein S3 n=1 Tax=Tanacetum coccineum TaxID=301880 RepID=A0ABQ5FJJ2_9ASTR